jgi:hypothetical protein
MDDMTHQQTCDGVIVDWLEELPLDELPTEYAKMIVKEFREGDLDVTEAIANLRENCNEDMKDQILQNKQLKELLDEIVDD